MLALKTFYNDVQIKSKEDYVNAYNRLEAYLKTLPGVSAIGKFGEISCPSILDMDIIIVANDQYCGLIYKKVKNFISTDIDLSYMCRHDPLLLSLSSIHNVSHLHSLNGLTLTHNPERIKIPEIEPVYSILLDLVWATFLLPTAIEITKNPIKYGSLYTLQVLKNIVMAIKNLSILTGQGLDLSSENEYLRRDYIIQKVSSIMVLNRFYDTIQQFLNSMNDIEKLSIFKYGTKTTGTSIKTNLFTTYYQSSKNSFQIKHNKIHINLSDTFFTMLDHVKKQKSQINELNKYILLSLQTVKYYELLDIPYPFILPFGFRFFRKDVTYKILQMFYKLFPSSTIKLKFL